MSERARLPFAPAVRPAAPGADWAVPTAVPVGDAGSPLIPELAGRSPTHNESQLLSGDPIKAASSNVEEFWWVWNGPTGTGQTYNPVLFVRFLSGDMGYYRGVPLSVAVAFIETDSPGRFVWRSLRDVYPWVRLKAGTGERKPPQVVRLYNR